MNIKVAFIDSLCPKGHKVFNELTIKALRDYTDIDLKVIATDICVNKEEIDYNIPKKYYKKQRGFFFSKFFYRLDEIIRWSWIIKIIDLEKPDLILLSSFDTISLNFIKNWINYPLYIFNHNNIDQLEKSFIKRMFYKNISKHIFLIVFESYMKNFLIKRYNISSNNIIVIPHIVNSNQISPPKIRRKDLITLFAPSSSSDNTVFNNINKNAGILEKNNFFLLAKSSLKEFMQIKSNNLVYKNWFSNEDYKKMMELSDAIFLPLPKTFNCRVSNVANEAISHGKPLIITRTDFSLFLDEKYPELCYIIEGNLITDIYDIRIWVNNVNKSIFSISREKYLSCHSPKTFVIKFLEGICSQNLCINKSEIMDCLNTLRSEPTGTIRYIKAEPGMLKATECLNKE